MRLPFIALFAGTGWLMFALTRSCSARAPACGRRSPSTLRRFFSPRRAAGSCRTGRCCLRSPAPRLLFAPLFFEERSRSAVWRRGWPAASGSALPVSQNIARSFSPSASSPSSPCRRANGVGSPIPRLMSLRCSAWRALAGHRLERGEPLGLLRLSGRAGRAGRALAARAGRRDGSGQIVWVTPWIFVPLVGGLIAARGWRARRAAPVSSLPRAAADRIFHIDAALGRAGPAALADAGLVLRLSAARRLARRGLGGRGFNLRAGRSLRPALLGAIARLRSPPRRRPAGSNGSCACRAASSIRRSRR